MSVPRFSLPAGFWRRSLPVLAIAAATVCAFVFRLDKVFSFEMLAASRMALHDLVAAHGVSALAAFVAIYCVLVALSVPGASVMTLAGGFAFGTLVGGMAAAIGSTLGASALYFVATTSLAPLLRERADGIVARLRKGFAADAAAYMLFLRLSPVFPFWLVNLGSAVAGIPFRTFLWTTALGILPATFTFAFAGASLDNLVAMAQATQTNCKALGMPHCPLQLPLSAILTPRMVALLVALSLVALLPVGVKKTTRGTAQTHSGFSHTMTNLTPDLCVIGAGSGGLSVAAGAARLGVPVVLIEKGLMGGDCLNVGCVPSKALIACAAAAQTMRTAGTFGLRPHDARADWTAVQSRIRHVIAAIKPNDSVARYEAMGVKVIQSNARFLDRATVEAGGFTIKARRFVVATGSSPAVPPIAGLEQIRWLTNETIFDIGELPTHLIILGAGPIGVELAQAFRRLGSDVTMLDAGAALAREDVELAAPVLNTLMREGVTLHQHVKVLSAEPHSSGLRLLIEDARSGGFQQSITGSHLLIAIGRTANVQGLGLEQAGVAFDAHGIRVGRNLRSSNRRIYAVGDVAGGAQFTHAANYHAGLVLRQTLFRLRARLQPQTIPRVTYTAPEIAAVGLSENEARAQHNHVRVLRWPFSTNDRGDTDDATTGHVKIITTRNGKILGAGIIGAHAGELIGLWCLAVTKGMKIGAIAQLMLPYPTLSEASRRAAIGYYAGQFDRPIVRKILKWLRRLP